MKHLPCECDRCGNSFIDDVYVFNGGFFCGECRYYIRTGKHAHANHNNHALTDASFQSEHQYNGGNSVHMLNRFEVYQCETARQAEILGQWISDCSLSID